MGKCSRIHVAERENKTADVHRQRQGHEEIECLKQEPSIQKFLPNGPALSTRMQQRFQSQFHTVTPLGHHAPDQVQATLITVQNKQQIGRNMCRLQIVKKKVVQIVKSNRTLILVHTL